MTEGEIIVVAKIMLTADHWCGMCSDDLLSQLTEAFPAYSAAIKAVDAVSHELHDRIKAARDTWGASGETTPAPQVWLV